MGCNWVRSVEDVDWWSGEWMQREGKGVGGGSKAACVNIYKYFQTILEMSGC